MKNKKYHTVGIVLKYHTVGIVLKYHTVGIVIKYHTVGIVLKYHTVGIVPKSNWKIDKRGKIDTSNTQIHDSSLSKLGTCNSVKSGGLSVFSIH